MIQASGGTIEKRGGSWWFVPNGTRVGGEPPPSGQVPLEPMTCGPTPFVPVPGGFRHPTRGYCYPRLASRYTSMGEVSGGHGIDIALGLGLIAVVGAIMWAYQPKYLKT